MAEPWAKFRSLCHYYAECVKYSEHSQEYLFPDQLNKSFMLPRLPANWHLREDEFEIETVREDAYIRAVLLKDSDEDELFIGYPLNSFVSPDGFECLCPILIFPVTIAVRGPGYTTGLRMRIDRRGISINQDWVDHHIPRSEQPAFRRACEHVEDEMGCVNVEMVLDYIAAHFKDLEVDPNRMEFSVRNSQAKKSLLNTAVLFEGTKTKYTKNLIRELHRISKEPDSVLDSTSLAYVFREPCLEETGPDIKRIPVSFTKRPLNNGQFAAIEESLNRHVVKVMGPPGTGKSFMAVNLIANEVLNGGSVLFTSKNHKAIHAIFDKAPEAVDNADFPLVSFCTTPDNPTNADWQKSQKDVDIRLDKIKALSQMLEIPSAELNSQMSSLSGKELDVALSIYRDAESGIYRYQKMRDLISRYERLLCEIEGKLECVPAVKRESEEFLALLEKSESLMLEAHEGTLIQRMVSLIGRMFNKNSPSVDVRAQLLEIAPNVANYYVSRKTAAKEIRRILSLLKCRRIIKDWEQTELTVLKGEQSNINYEELKRGVAQSLDAAAKVVQSAYLEEIVQRSCEVDSPEALVAYCKDSSDAVQKTTALDFLSGIGDEGKFDAALGWFRNYLNVFPAWASTMLSLRRAAPCLPGVFTLAIIDEASQCDIPPMIPVLFRAQRVAVVGDPKQFPPVVDLKASRDRMFRRKFHVDGSEFKRYSFCQNNAFSVVPGKSLLLNEHFRCADGIAEYFNEEFYSGELTLCCETGRTGTSAVGGLKPGMMWIDAPGGDNAEMAAALEYLRDLNVRGFKGSVGVISPLRDLANRFKTLVAENSSNVPKQLDVQSQISTANGFQGGECDVILFLLGLNGDRTRGEDWYITAAENKYIYNVSVSRARQVFVAFGDRKRVSLCGISYIQKLIPETRPPRKPNVGPGEEKLKIALDRAGIMTVPQFPVLNRYLDLAIPDAKIDIEVDGQAWHLDRNGCRKADDIHRDVQLEAAGWKVVRFWHHEVVTDAAKCVAKIKEVVRENSKSPRTA